MNHKQYQYIISSINSDEYTYLNKLYSTHFDWAEWKKVKSSYQEVNLQLLGTLEYDTNNNIHVNNLIIYDPDYDINNPNHTFIDSISHIYDEELKLNFDEQIAIFCCYYDKISIVDTYNINNKLNEFKLSLYDGDPIFTKKLINVAIAFNILYMIYS